MGQQSLSQVIQLAIGHHYEGGRVEELGRQLVLEPGNDSIDMISERDRSKSMPMRRTESSGLMVNWEPVRSTNPTGSADT